MLSRPLAALLALALLLPASPGSGAPLAPDEGPAFNAWLRGVQSRVIHSAKKSHGVPRSARVLVFMLVRLDGSVGDVHSLSSSDPDPRYPALAARVVGLAGPFPPVPPNVHHENGVKIVVPLFFHVRETRRRHRR